MLYANFGFNFVELIVNEVITTCMVKKQHIQWSQKAGSLLANSHG